MPKERYFLPTLQENLTELKIEGKEFHHLFHVMRGKVHDTVEIVNGKGILAFGKISALSKKYATLTLFEIQKEKKAEFELIIAEAMPRQNRLDTILEKVTELGATQIWLFQGDLSEKKIKDDQILRLEAITIAAMKQSGRLWLPDLKIVRSLHEWQKPEFPLFFGDLNPEAPTLFSSLKGLEGAKGVIFVTGPESGLTEEEIETLRNLGGLGTKLHPLILRTDTAAIAAATIISHWALCS